MTSDFVIEKIIELTFFLCSTIIDILYFCAGATVFIVLLTTDFTTKNLDTKAIRIYAVCLFVIWCWIYSKLIVL